MVEKFNLKDFSLLEKFVLRCFCHVKDQGGHFDHPPANSKTKEARTVKLCTVIAYYKTIITKQLKFLNSHCSVVCSY